MVSWQEWHYCGCDDPTTAGGPATIQAIVKDPREAAHAATNVFARQAEGAGRAPYPQAIAGTPDAAARSTPPAAASSSSTRRKRADRRAAAVRARRRPTSSCPQDSSTGRRLPRLQPRRRAARREPPSRPRRPAPEPRLRARRAAARRASARAPRTRRRPQAPRRSPAQPSVRRQVVVPVAEHLEGAPEALLGALLVERVVDVGGVEGVDGRGEGLDLALARLDRAGERDARGR